MYAYRVSVVQQLHQHDYELRLRYCRWFNDHLNNNDALDLTFFTDEAWIHLSGYVNSQNYRTWATENPHNYVETSLHPLKVGIWVAMSRRRIIGPIFFYETVNGRRYRTDILSPFMEQLHDDELELGNFQQDGAPAHIAGETLRFLGEFYDNRIISRGLWPPRSPDLTPLDYYFFGKLKNNIFKSRMHDLNELQEAIVRETQRVTVVELQNVFENMKRRVNLCIENEGGAFSTFVINYQ